MCVVVVVCVCVCLTGESAIAIACEVHVCLLGACLSRPLTWPSVGANAAEDTTKTEQKGTRPAPGSLTDCLPGGHSTQHLMKCYPARAR
jgi:hypothetical protein